MNIEELHDAVSVEDAADKVVLGIRQRRLVHMVMLEPHQAKLIASELIDAAKAAEAVMANRAVSS